MAERLAVITDHPWSSVDIEEHLLAGVGLTVVEPMTDNEDELVELVANAVAILTCFASVTAKVIAGAPHLEVISRYGVGIDNIDVDAATRRGIPVTNVPVFCVDEVAEHVVALMFALRRRTTSYDHAVRDGSWDLATGIPLHRLAGQTLGILGVGNIGSAVAARAQGLGMRVIAHTANPDARLTAAGVEAVDLATLAATSDVLSLHAPLTARTRGIIDAAFLRSMKSTAVLVNTARGALVDQIALADALVAGQIAGAGLDVFEPERLPQGHPLLDAPNTVLTPHVAFYSEQSIASLRQQAATAAAAVLAGSPDRPPIVNRDALATNSTSPLSNTNRELTGPHET